MTYPQALQNTRDCPGVRAARYVSVVLLFLSAPPVCSPAVRIRQIAVSKAEKYIVAHLREDGTADLSELPESQRMIRAEFLQSVLFEANEDVHGLEISINGATVQGFLAPPKSQWNLGRGSTVKRHITFENCHFDSVNLNGVYFENGLSVQSSDFSALTLGGIHVKGRMILQEIKIRPSSEPHSPASLGLLLSGNIEGTLQVGDISPLFNAGGLKATQVQILAEKASQSVFRLQRLQAEDLFLLGVPAEHSSLQSLNLTDASVNGSIAIEGVRLNELSASGLRVGGDLILTDVLVQNLMDLSGANFTTFRWGLPTCDGRPDGNCWPKMTRITGTSFRELNIEQTAQSKSNPNSGEKWPLPSATVLRNQELVLNFLRHADFSGPAYTSYIQSLRNHGLEVAAGDTQIAMHSHEREARWHESSGFLGLIGAAAFVAVDLAQLILFGYGQSALPPFLWSLAFVAFGTAVFRNEKRMEPVGEHPPMFTAFWYSLELFLPVVDLGVAKNWRPSQKSFPLLTYARIHQLAGWILVPVALATLTGAFK